MSGERRASRSAIAASIAAVEDRWGLDLDDQRTFGEMVYDEVLAALLDEVRTVLESVEWGDFDGHEHRCPECDGREKHGHHSDCRLSALLSRLKREEGSDG